MKKQLLYFLLLTQIVFFQGCASKNKTEQIPNLKESSQNKDIAEDEFLDEFTDEFSNEFQAEAKSDPLEGYNRVMTTFNDGLYEYVMYPVSKGYRAITHEDVRKSVGNFFHNLLYPVRLVNNLLQGKVQNSAEETGRFLINSTVGVLGLFDVAKSQFGLEPHNEDFGQTLGFWGVEPGPHIVLPFFGPSNLRDSLSLYPDGFVDPLDSKDSLASYKLTDNYVEYLSSKFIDKVNTTANNPEAYYELKKDAVDLYPYLRDIYEQYRVKQINK